MEATMNRSAFRFIALQGGVCLLALAALPLLAVIGIMARGAVIALAACAVALCALLYPVSVRFREWLKTQAEVEYRHRGLRLARGVLLHPAHSWARWEGDRIAVGADDLLLSTLGPVDAIDLPASGSRAVQGRPLFRVRHGERSVEVCSPLSGSVCESNPVLPLHPRLMNEQPFTHGWAVRLAPSAATVDEIDSLRPARQAREWFNDEVDRALAFSGSKASSTTAMCAGIDEAAWRRLSPMFETASRESRERLGEER